jgi:hypothetical protein
MGFIGKQLMNDKYLYITRPPEGEDLYTQLQRNTLAELQRLSGKVWTDYNPHDPGVTVADVANYALTETDYKLSFPLEDYLTEIDGKWTTEKYGLFTPREVYPSTPVIADDYRKLLSAYFPMIENVKVKADKRKGRLDFMLRISPFFTDSHTLEDHVWYFLNAHRNLCEQIGSIEIEQPEKLYLSADLEIETGMNATDILVDIYWTAMQYLSETIEISHRSSDGTLPMPEDEWYNGPVDDIHTDIPVQNDTEHELFYRFMGIPGLVSIKTCYFKDTEGHPVTDFKKGYSLQIPKDFNHVTVRIGKEKVYADIQEFKERLRAKYFMKDNYRTRQYIQERNYEDNWDKKENTKNNKTQYTARYRNVYSHSSIAGDMPACYATSEHDFTSQTSTEDRAQIQNFGNYLKMFDLLIQRGMSELDGLKKSMSVNGTDNGLSQQELLSGDILEIGKENDRYRDITALRNRYMDFLDGLYGVDSNPLWLKDFEIYGQTEDDRLRRRMKFLTALPLLTRDRSRSFDIYGSYGKDNIPVVKKHLSLLLDFNSDEGISVGNILPGHNLILMGEDKKGQAVRNLINARMIDDTEFSAESVFSIKADTPPKTTEEKLKRNEDLRCNLPIFNSNWISSSLFREGISLNNYKIIKSANMEWLLVFRGKEETNYMNLGRSDDRKKLEGWANTLCRYLRELNRQSETVYIIEKSLFGRDDPFTVMLVFSGWTARTHSMRFRNGCERTARAVIPAHLKMETYWINSAQMQYFEKCYHRWRDCLQGNVSENTRLSLQSYMMRILSTDFVWKQNNNKEDNGKIT